MMLIYSCHSQNVRLPGSYHKVDSGLDQIPSDIPADTINVHLEINLIADIGPGAFSHLNQCESLKLSDNKLTKVRKHMWQGLVKLRRFFLKYNLIANIEPGAFSYLTQCKWLDLSSNKLTTIRRDMWEKLNKLETLYLNDNFISVIEAGAFIDLKHCSELVLASNNLTRVRRDTFKGLAATLKLDISDNTSTAFNQDPSYTSINVFGFISATTH